MLSHQCSPHAMKGILIGFYYVIHFGVGGLFDLVQTLACSHVHTTRLSISCCMISNIVITIIAVMSFIVYCIVVCKYKLRERDNSKWLMCTSLQRSIMEVERTTLILLIWIRTNDSSEHNKCPKLEILKCAC